MSANGALTLSEVRPRAAAALAPASDGDPPVFVDYPEAVDVPCLVVIWDDPWLTFRTSCYWDAEMSVLAVAGRVETGPGIETLEALAGYTIGRLRADRYSWAQSSSQAPREIMIGGVPYLAARVNYRVAVTI